ncbi:DUF4431 domain-containing protein [Rhodobacter sp. NSM]|uniref:DUF4431 domain-containing protein n=1 Tax=Rhodobacter sp. NSM TaxID=3457501 RepID=UPI003FD5D227
MRSRTIPPKPRRARALPWIALAALLPVAAPALAESAIPLSNVIAIPEDLSLPPAPCHSYAGTMTLSGTIVRRTWHTPDPMSDGYRNVSGEVLKLPSPICIYADPDPDEPQPAIVGVTEITVTRLEGVAGDRVTVTGSPYHAHTAHHMTRLLLDGGVTDRPPAAPRQEPLVTVTPVPYQLPFRDAQSARLFPQLVLSDPPVCRTTEADGTTCFAGDSENVIALRTAPSRDAIALGCRLTLNSASLEAGIRSCANAAAAAGVAPGLVLSCAREGGLSRPAGQARIDCRWSADARTAVLDLVIRK